jgi:hypothetical protein
VARFQESVLIYTPGLKPLGKSIILFQKNYNLI